MYHTSHSMSELSINGTSKANNGRMCTKLTMKLDSKLNQKKPRTSWSEYADSNYNL